LTDWASPASFGLSLKNTNQRVHANVVRLTHIGGPTMLIAVVGRRLLTGLTFGIPSQRYKFSWAGGRGCSTYSRREEGVVQVVHRFLAD
jgi:hypothetical protein